METIKEVLMRRDRISAEQADRQIAQAKDILRQYLENDELDKAFYICEEEFGLEPDYIEQLIL